MFFFSKIKVDNCVSGELGVSLHELEVTSKNHVPTVTSGPFLGGGGGQDFTQRMHNYPLPLNTFSWSVNQYLLSHVFLFTKNNQKH